MSEVVHLSRQLEDKFDKEKIEISFGKNSVVGQAQEQVGVLNQRETLSIRTKKQRSALVKIQLLVKNKLVNQ